ncbi:MAG: hypothetical protein JXQ29_10570 [Planctomycetes bacterium]|nr:hypothetical protein [Planctomycetota bacterium]
MRAAVLCLVVMSLAATAAPAQPHSHGWFVPGYRHIHYVSPQGAVTSVSFTTSYVYAAIMNWDNRTVLAFDYSLNAILQIDPQNLTVVGTLLKDPLLTATTAVADMVFDSNGDLFVAGTTGRPGISRTSVTNPALTPIVNTAPLATVGNMSLDPDTGELIAVPGLTAGTVCYLVRRDGSTFQTLGTGFVTRYGTYRHIPTGDIYSGSCCGRSGGGSNAALVRLAAGTTVATTLFPNDTIRGAYSPWPDRASAATQRLIVATWRDTGSPGADGLWQVDIATTTMSKLATITTGNTHKAVHVFGRNLQTVRVAQGQWAVRLSFPGMAGMGYAVALSISGTRPFPRLADGRAIPITPDIFTATSLSTGLAPYFTHNIGALNASAQAAALVDVSTLGKGLNGIRLFLLAAVLDPKAPFGLSVIADPVALVIEGL